ncbi:MULTISPECIES: hypothetical protein [Eikenella]|jgi:hypothetical protein|nr:MULTISPECIES: hypothetical protein [Eikenella]
MEVFHDERGSFILRWTRKLKDGRVIRAKSKPFKIYISKFA